MVKQGEEGGTLETREEGTNNKVVPTGGGWGGVSAGDDVGPGGEVDGATTCACEGGRRGEDERGEGEAD